MLFSYVVPQLIETTAGVHQKDRLGVFMRTAVALAVSCLTFATLSAAEFAAAAIKKDTNIPAQSLGSALEAFARDRSLQFIYATTEVETLRTSGVSGNLSASEALSGLLQGTGLSYRFLDEKTVTVQPASLAPRDGVGMVQDATTSSSDPTLIQSRLRLAQAEERTSAPAQQGEGNSEDLERDMRLEEIVVTAQRRAESVQDVPMTVSALSEDRLIKQNVTDLQSLSFAVPSMTSYQISPGQTLVSIRGVSTFRGESALVGLYMDDIPLTGGIRLGTGSGLDAGMNDLSRVEVLKGPQGTLFGEGAMGGVVRYITNDPELDHLGGRLTATYYGTRSGDDSGEARGVLNLPLVQDRLGLRIAAEHDRYGGWIDNVTSGEENYNDATATDVRAKLLFMPSDSLRITALVNTHRLRSDGTNIVNTGDFDDSLFRQAVGFLPVGQDVPTTQSSGFNLYNLTVDYDLGFANIVSSTSRFDASLHPINYQTQVAGNIEFLIDRTRGEQEVTSQEIRLVSNGDSPFRWIVGGNYKDTLVQAFPGGADAVLALYQNPIDPPLILTFPGNDNSTEGRSEAFAGFVDASYLFFDRLELGGGVRYFGEDRGSVTSTTAGTTVLDQDGNYTATTYRLFGKYAVSDQVNVYASYATGFRPGEFNGVEGIAVGGLPLTDPETSDFVELGVKSSFFEGRLVANLAAFDGHYDNQLQLVARLVGSQFANFYDNVGDGRIRGFEWELETSPMPGLNLRATGVLLDTEYTSSAPGAPIQAGDPIDFVPEYDVNLAANYEFNWSEAIRGFFNINSSWKGAVQNTNRGVGLGAAPIDRNEPLNFVNASVGAMFNGIEVTLFARNITDERGRLIAQFTGIWPQARPRSIGISVSKTF